MNPKQIEEFFHLTPVQKHLLRQSEQVGPQAHLAQFSCQLVGPLDVSAFERAWQKVTNHQPGLRTTFVSGDLKEPVQVINRNVGVALEKQDWRNLSEGDQARRLAELLQSDRQSGFVLKTPPLWRMTLIRLDEERHHFVWTYHELLFDEASLPYLFNEALQCYDAILRVQKPPLPMPVSLRKYVDWIKKHDPLATEQFWRTTLKDFRRPIVIAPTLPEMAVHLASEKASTLRALAAQQYIAPEVMAYGAWALLLSRLSGQTEVVFGVQVSGRSPHFHGAERLIGHLRNTVPLRVRIAPDAMVIEWLTDLQKQWQEVQRFSHASLTQIQNWSELTMPQSLFESVVVFDAAPAASGINREVAGLRVEYDSLAAPNHFPLAVMIKDCDAWEVTGDAHVTHLRFLLEQFAIAPQRRLAEIVLPSEPVPPKTSATDRETNTPPPPVLPVPWTQTEDEEQGWVDWLKGDTCVHELFEQRVAQTPAAVAVQLQGQTITYQELNARANQLAHYLRKLNVVPSIPVGLCFAPSIDGIVGILGVLKAGGAYLPLEATFSEDDLQQIITDSSTSVVLTQARLEPKFRTIPLHCIVLCLDSDWSVIAEEETGNLACQVSDEHPACFLIEAELPAVITHARLAQAVRSVREWFSFGPNNPWHLFSDSPAPVPVNISPEPVSVLNDEVLNGMNRGMDWFDLQPELFSENGNHGELKQTPEPDFSLEVDITLDADISADFESDFELDVPIAPEPTAPPQVAAEVTAPAVELPAMASPEIAPPALVWAELDPLELDLPETLPVVELAELELPEPELPVVDLAATDPVVAESPELPVVDLAAADSAATSPAAIESPWSMFAATESPEPESSTVEFSIVEPSTLAPIQQWFFAQRPAALHHHNVSLLVEIGDNLERAALQQALQVVVAHHAALRWRFTENEKGWQLQEDIDGAALPFEYVDFSAKWARSQRKAIEETSDKLQASLHLSEGPLWRAAYFDLGGNRSHRLLIIAHQLIADDASLRIFLHDWLTVYWQLRRDQALCLPPPTASYQEWLQSLETSIEPDEVRYWQQLATKSWRALPIDRPQGANRYSNVDRVFVSLNSKETESLLHYIPSVAEADVNEIVLTALTLALAQWAGESGAWLELERDVRNSSGPNVARTLGWFAAKFPVNLEVDTLTDAAASLRTIKTQLRAIPRQGVSYGLWRYNNGGDVSLRDLPQPKISFKYLAFPNDETAWSLAPESVGPEHCPHNDRNVVIAVTGAMNLNMLEFRWEYAREQFEQKNIGFLVNSFIGELRHLIQHYSQQRARSGD